MVSVVSRVVLVVSMVMLVVSVALVNWFEMWCERIWTPRIEFAGI